MPLSINFTTPSTGAVATYHVVNQVTLDRQLTQTGATVSSYLSKDAKDAGKFPMHTQQITLDGLPDKGVDAFDYSESALITPAPLDFVSPPYANRYSFAGAEIVT